MATPNVAKYSQLLEGRKLVQRKAEVDRYLHAHTNPFQQPRTGGGGVTRLLKIMFMKRNNSNKCHKLFIIILN